MIAFASRTGNVRYIVNKLGLPYVEITKGLTIQEPFLLFTYTDGLGSVPAIVEEFIKENYTNCKGVIASGNSNFGHHVFCQSANKISKQFGIPIVRKIELRGFPKDYEAIIDYYNHTVRSEVSI